jgi:hypothetical protein
MGVYDNTSIGYRYDWEEERYEDIYGNEVEYSEVYSNYISHNGNRYIYVAYTDCYLVSEKWEDDGVNLYYKTFRANKLVQVNSYSFYNNNSTIYETQDEEFNLWTNISNSFLVGGAVNQPTYFRSSQIAKDGKFAINGWKTYSNYFRGNQYVSSASVKGAKSAFNSVVKTTSRISVGLNLLNYGVTYANYKAGNVTSGRYYVQQTINTIGLFGPIGAGLAIGLSAIDAIWGDQIEFWIRN